MLATCLRNTRRFGLSTCHPPTKRAGEETRDQPSLPNRANLISRIPEGEAVK